MDVKSEWKCISTLIGYKIIFIKIKFLTINFTTVSFALKIIDKIKLFVY